MSEYFSVVERRKREKMRKSVGKMINVVNSSKFDDNNSNWSELNSWGKTEETLTREDKLVVRKICTIITVESNIAVKRDGFVRLRSQRSGRVVSPFTQINSLAMLSVATQIAKRYEWYYKAYGLTIFAFELISVKQASTRLSHNYWVLMSGINDSKWWTVSP